LVGHVRRRIRRFAAARWAGGGEAVRRALRGAAIQPKLRVGPQDDAYEREADAVAARVMAGPAAPTPIAAAAPGQVQRLCVACEEETLAAPPDEIRRQPVEEEEEEVQAKALPEALQRQKMEEEEEEPVQAKRTDGAPTAAAAIPSGVPALGGAGQPLSGSVRSFFEPRFGANFSDVRVHTGPHAAAAARALKARAFTTGRDVVFGAGEYAPHARAGGELLAHELTHVIQQRGYRRRPDGAAPAPLPVRRWAIGAAHAPALPDWTTVPDGAAGGDDHRPRLAEAEAIVRGVINDPQCRTFFRDHCPAGTDATLETLFNNALIYHRPTTDGRAGSTELGTSNISYNLRPYAQGKYSLAATLLHELYHVCDPNAPAGQAEITAENALERCRLYTPSIEIVIPQVAAVGDRVGIGGAGFGIAQGPGDRVTIGGVNAPILSWGLSQTPGSSMVAIVIQIPAGVAGTVDLRVFHHGIASAPHQLTVR
jgi:hypothetical protein